MRKQEKSFFYREQGFIEPENHIVGLVTKKQLAIYLQISVSMIDKLIADGLPNIKIGRSIRFDIPHVMAHLNRKGHP